MAISDPLVMPIAREMLDCLAQEMAKVPSPPANVGLRPGVVVDHLKSISRDECCEGLAWVRPDPFYPSSGTAETGPFPSPDETPNRQGTLAWAVTLELGAIRCAPVGDETTLPSESDWDNATQQVMDDAAAIRRAICCYIEAAHGRALKVLPGAWQPIAVQGGCVGGFMTVTIKGPACDCVDAGPESS
jgi:hypothetical protein